MKQKWTDMHHAKIINVETCAAGEIITYQRGTEIFKVLKRPCGHQGMLEVEDLRMPCEACADREQRRREKPWLFER